MLRFSFTKREREREKKKKKEKERHLLLKESERKLPQHLKKKPQAEIETSHKSQVTIEISYSPDEGTLLSVRPSGILSLNMIDSNG